MSDLYVFGVFWVQLYWLEGWVGVFSSVGLGCYGAARHFPSFFEVESSDIPGEQILPQSIMGRWPKFGNITVTWTCTIYIYHSYGDKFP